MSARHAYYFVLATGCFLTGLGHYIAGPFIVILAMVYRERIVAFDEKPPLPLSPPSRASIPERAKDE